MIFFFIIYDVQFFWKMATSTNSMQSTVTDDEFKDWVKIECTNQEGTNHKGTNLEGTSLSCSVDDQTLQVTESYHANVTREGINWGNQLWNKLPEDTQTIVSFVSSAVVPNCLLNFDNDIISNGFKFSYKFGRALHLLKNK